MKRFLGLSILSVLLLSTVALAYHEERVVPNPISDGNTNRPTRISGFSVYSLALGGSSLTPRDFRIQFERFGLDKLLEILESPFTRVNGITKEELIKEIKEEK